MAISVHLAHETGGFALLRAAIRMRLYTSPCSFLRASLLGQLLPQAIALRHRAFEQVLDTLYAGKEGLLPTFFLL